MTFSKEKEEQLVTKNINFATLLLTLTKFSNLQSPSDGVNT